MASSVGGGGVPASIGGYHVVRRLGVGGMSEVLLAVSRGPHGFTRKVVLKRLLPSCEAEPELARSLAAEAMAYARLSHPAIVRLFDFFEADGRPTMVLEHVDGLSLSRLRAALRGPPRLRLDDRAILYIGYRIFEALAAAHGAQDPLTGEFAPVIHRDVSPGNVLIPWDGYVKLADFGVAKVSGVTADTRAGFIKGTYGYMAPEQVLGEPVTVRTDVYAACLLLRELLLGRITFPRGDTPELEFLRAMAEPKLAPIEVLRPGIPRVVATALREGLRVDPDRRSVSAAEMTEVLRSVVGLDAAHAALVEALADVRSRPPFLPPVAKQSAPSFDSLSPCAVTSGPTTTRQAAAFRTPAPPPAPATPARRVRLRARAAAAIAAGALAASAFAVLPAATSREIALPLAASALAEAPIPLPLPLSLPHALAPALPLPCGPHLVRVGSAGALHVVQLRCGGTARVDAR